MPKVTHRAAITSPMEAGVLLRAIDAYSGYPVTHAALRLAPHVFVRPGELRHAEWTEFDLTKNVWTIPAEKTKMRVAHRVPLTRQVLAILEELREISGRNADAFVGNEKTHSLIEHLNGKDHLASRLRILHRIRQQIDEDTA